MRLSITYWYKKLLATFYIDQETIKILMNKESLINRAFVILNKAGFIISERCDIRPRSFDIAVRREQFTALDKGNLKY